VKPLKVAILTSDKRDHDRDYSNPRPGFGTAPAALLQGFAKLPEVEIHIVCCTQKPLASPEKIAPNIFYHSLLVPKMGWMRTFYSGCILAARKKLREIQPDLVHGQGTERDCAISAVFSGFPNVLTLHGNMRLIAQVNSAPPFSFLWLSARLERLVLPRTDGVVCITNYTREAVRNLARATWLLPNAVEEGLFNVRAAPDTSAPPVGLCIGSVCLRKNQNAFIRALDPLAKEKKFKILFASDPPAGLYGEEFIQLIRERPWCEHIGFINREQLKIQLASASFVVLPTVEDNCPMVVLEAMAAGVPAMASNVGGVPDLIEDGKTGLLCDPARPASFREGIEKLLTDRSYVQRLADNAKVEAQRRFHPEVIARKHLEIYREVLNQMAR